jgi:MFS family permease
VSSREFWHEEDASTKQPGTSWLMEALPTTAVTPAAEPDGFLPSGREVTRLRDLSSIQWKSGIAAWLGWMFDGLDMHLYVLVAAPFVAHLLEVTSERDPLVGYYSSWIQAAFLIGWALGGGFFGRIGDRLGRSRALMLTILTYALFTGLSFFAQTWWQLLVFRFLAALGIGGERAVGASLLAETWPRGWRPWIAAVLQTGVNLGVMLAGLANFLLADYPKRTVFLVGVLPALLVLWIRRAVPEPEEWHAARHRSTRVETGFLELFRGSARRTTVLTLLVCALALTAHWAFLFWYLQHLRNLPDLSSWTDSEKSQLVSKAVWLVTLASIAGTLWRPGWHAGWATGGRSLPSASGISGRCSPPMPCLSTTAAFGTGSQRLASVRGSLRCSRCTCHPCFPRSCGPPAQASATTLAASSLDWARFSSAFSPGSATTAWRFSMPACCSSPRPGSPC